jgi:hypothetical protein
MKVDKEVLIKQHFWILLSLAALLPLICLFILWTYASDSVEGKKKEVTATKDRLNKIKSPKNEKWLAALGVKEEKVDAQKDKVWAEAWKAQADMVLFPESFPGAQEVNEKLYFGDPLSENFRINYARAKGPYRAQYDANIELVDPVKSAVVGQVQFKGGPEGIVPPFSGHFENIPPDSIELWLLQEELAMERELLRIIRDTNDMIATFHKQSGAPKPDKSKGEIDHQIFTNSDFKLDLVLAEEKGKKIFRCTLTNISKRRQPLGIPFLVSVKGLEDAQGFFADGEPLAPGASIVVKDRQGGDQEKDLTLQTQSGVLTGEVLQGVMQVYNWRTAPVKRIDMIKMGIQSNRTQGALNPPGFDKAAADAAAAAQQAQQSTQSSSESGTSTGGGMEGFMQRMQRMGMERGGGAGFGGGGRGDQTKNGFEKNRYMSVSKQVRRIPILLAVVMDQAHVQDFLTIVANSKLRIQTTQVYWQRFHDDIKPTFSEEDKPGEPQKTPGTTPAPALTKGALGGKGGMGAGLDEGPRTRPGVAAPGRGAMGGGMGMGAGMQDMMLQMRRRMAGGMAGGMGGGIGATPGQPSGYAPAEASVDIEPEEESNLVEVAVYGIASLYERYPPKKEGTDVAATTNP